MITADTSSAMTRQKSGWDDEKTIAAMQTLEGWIKDGVIPSLETMSENNEDVFSRLARSL